jgi:hypothetical protein
MQAVVVAVVGELLLVQAVQAVVVLALELHSTLV